VERAFASKLDEDESVEFYLKLPSKFRAETPIGPYNPDWAIKMTGRNDAAL
jgi:type III restriction enzyme